MVAEKTGNIGFITSKKIKFKNRMPSNQAFASNNEMTGSVRKIYLQH